MSTLNSSPHRSESQKPNPSQGKAAPTLPGWLSNIFIHLLPQASPELASMLPCRWSIGLPWLLVGRQLPTPGHWELPKPHQPFSLESLWRQRQGAHFPAHQAFLPASSTSPQRYTKCLACEIAF